ncbi:hypothetical protein GP486_000766 [Trichoglossum hirsutum]|uniref:K Homology domain-containing protein n=1 Tax=Trichoglossum hirsutum TaxID=265104 RepID=A0A9P8RT93_9PEZI|nr:hypothetical protein GP486_000766 [Trichoglossum hirsutum]
MTDDDRRSSKRSRFDQMEPRERERHGGTEESRRSSRFDRRSRSPSSRDSWRGRSRSPLKREPYSPSGKQEPFSPTAEERKKPAGDPAAAAAAAAAKINAQIQAKKNVQHVDVPAIRSNSSAGGKTASTSSHTGSNVNGEMYIADGDYIRDIEVNDLRNRYTLTKGSTQKMIKEETGADVTTRGAYYPDKSLATPANPPLYLHVTSTTKEGLEKAVQKIEELMQQELPNLVDERRFRRREPDQVERDEFGRRKWPEERIPIDLEPIPGFNLRAQVVGHGGAYVKHIQQETRCRVQIKGRGSGFMEHGTGRESDEPMYLHVAGPDPREVQHAKELCEDLLANVKQQYERFKEQPPPQQQYNYGHHNNGNYNQRGPDRGAYGGYHQSPPPTALSPTNQPNPAAAAPGAAGAPGAGGTAPQDYSAQYAQYYGGQDPYAAYGGYQNYVAYYSYYMQQQGQSGQIPGAPGQGAPGAPGAPGVPPPPPSEAPPPPPPSGSPPGTGGERYNAVPPPPGM